MSTPVYKKIIETLDAHGCTYKTQHHEPTLTSEIASRVSGVSMHSGAKAMLKTFVDPHLAENEIFHFNAWSLTDSVSMRYEDWLAIEKPTVVEIAKAVEETENGPESV